MAKLRIFIIILTVWVIWLLNIERFDPLNIDVPTTLYIVSAIVLVPTLLLPVTGQIRFGYVIAPIVAVYVALRLYNVFSPIPVTLPALIMESVVLIITLWIGRRISIDLESFESVVDDVVFETDGTRILNMSDGEQAINDELFRARKFERPVALLYVKLPSIGRLRRIYPNTFQYQLSLEQRYYKARIARIIEGMVYRVDVLMWYGDNLVIGLPETERAHVEQLATQISEIIGSTVLLQVPMGIAVFPQDGLIYSDLVAKAEKNLVNYAEVKEDTTQNDDNDDNNDGTPIPSGISPETHDDPMAITISKRKRPEMPEKISAFAAFTLSMQRLWVYFFGNIQLMPIHQITFTGLDNVKPFYNPDYWVNRIKHQSMSSRHIYQYIKRLMDLTIIILFSPFVLLVSLIVAIAVKLEDGGPILFSQERTGLGGRRFKMYKFRSMVMNAEEVREKTGIRQNERNEVVDANGVKLKNDPRITHTGRFIRATSLDELPQLWNVFNGDMSLVGPRPTSYGVDKYRLFHTQRLDVKPGLTGLWQIHDRGSTDFDNRTLWDMKYIDKFSLAMDLNILVRTVEVVIKKKGGR